MEQSAIDRTKIARGETYKGDQLPARVTYFGACLARRQCIDHSSLWRLHNQSSCFTAPIQETAYLIKPLSAAYFQKPPNRSHQMVVVRAYEALRTAEKLDMKSLSPPPAPAFGEPSPAAAFFSTLSSRTL